MRTKKRNFLLLSYVHMCTDHIRTEEGVGPVGRGLARCGGLLAVVGTSGLLMVGTTDCSATAHKMHRALRVTCSEQMPV